jgi:hypothetical protein
VPRPSASRPAARSADSVGPFQACTARAARSPAAPSRWTWPLGNRVLAPARQVVRRPVVQMVGSRHSSLRLPSTTVTASAPRRWPWAGVTRPAGQANSQASTAGVTSRGTDQARWGGVVDSRRTPSRPSATLPERGPISGGAGSFVGGFAGSFTGWFAGWLTGWLAGWFAGWFPSSCTRRMVRSTRAASDHAVVAGPGVSAGRMRTSFGVDPALGWPCGSRVDAGRITGLAGRPGRAARLSGRAEPGAGPGDTRRTPSASG